MQAPDFLRSFLTFTSDHKQKASKTASHEAPYTFNSARISLEAVCTVDDTRYVLGASCKTEIVGPDRDLWLDPNADFCIAASSDEFLIMKSWITNQVEVMLHPPSLGRQPERQAAKIDETFTDFVIHVVEAEAEELTDTTQIIEASYAHRPLVARTEYDDQGQHVIIDHPVKTMNVNPRDNVYQTDTGPIIVPNFDREPERGLEVGRFELAFEAFNRREWVEVLIRRPTPVEPGSAITADHYAVPRRIDGVRNRVLALT